MMPTDDTQSRLLEAAGQVFGERGFKAATIREICDLAKANIAAVNYHFGDKAELYKATLRFTVQDMICTMKVPEWPAGTPIASKIRSFIRGVITHMLENRHKEPCRLALMMRELHNISEEGRILVREFLRPIYEVLFGLIREALGQELAEDQLHLLGFSIIGQCFYFFVAQPVIMQIAGEEEFKTYTAERLADHVARFSLAALGLEPAPFRPVAAGELQEVPT